MQLLIDYVMRFVGTPYIWGGDDPIVGFDCSGFVQEVLAAFDLDPSGDQTAQGLHDYFTVNGQQHVQGPGALAFYGSNPKAITHVVVMVSDWQAVGADGGGSKSVDAKSAAEMNAYIKMRPLHYRNDLVTVLMPKYPLN